MLKTPLQSSLLTSHPYIKHGFFSRHEGFLKNSCDQTQNEANIKQICQWFDLPCDNFITLKQIHSTKVVWIDENSLFEETKDGDVLITRQRSFMLAVKTADCIPLLLYDPLSHLCCAIHAGWKGIRERIIHKTLQLLKSQGVHSENLVAVLGPCIHQENYEVEKNIYEDFIKQSRKLERFFKEGKDSSHYDFDVPGLVQFQLESEGVRQINHIKINTYQCSDDFYSHRRACHFLDETLGNQYSVISLI